MKRLKKISLLIFIPIFIGIILSIIGAAIKNSIVSNIGYLILAIGVPATGFVMVVVCLILMITGKLEDNKPENDISLQNFSEKETEQAQIEKINTSYGYQSNDAQGEYMMRHVSNNYKNSTPKEKLLGWLFFAFLMIDFALIPIFLFLKIYIGTYVCFGVFCGTIIISGIAVKIKQSLSIRGTTKLKPGQEIHNGKVKACLLSSTTNVGGSERRHTTRLVNVVYKIIIETPMEEYTAYSKRFYETGENVTFVKRSRKGASIIDEN